MNLRFKHAIMGILVGILFLVIGMSASAATSGIKDANGNTGYDVTEVTIPGPYQYREFVYHGYLTSTNVTITLPTWLTVEHDVYYIWYESSSNNYRTTTAAAWADDGTDLTFTATSAATAGGECFILAYSFSGF